VIRQIMIGLLANGHLLLESLPGLAKTRTVKALAKHLDAKMSRIQFTPDLVAVGHHRRRSAASDRRARTRSAFSRARCSAI
jgi:hypothetical protein